MGKRVNTLCTAALLLALSAALFSACGDNRPDNAEQNGAGGPRTRAQGTSYGPRNSTAAARADHLATLARGMHGVQDANCVVFGRYAIVGLDVDPAMDRSHVGTTKYAVAEAFRKDPYGANALVTADIDMVQRIREIRTDVQNGRPLAGFAEELADMVGRLMPEVPGAPVRPAAPDNPDPSRPPRGTR